MVFTWMDGWVDVRAVCHEFSSHPPPPLTHTSTINNTTHNQDRARPFLDRFKYAPNVMYLHSDERCVFS